MTPEEFWAQLDAQAAGYAGSLRRAFIIAVAKARTRVNSGELLALVTLGDVDGAVQLLVGHETMWADVQAAFRVAVVQASGVLAAELTTSLGQPVARVAFGVANPQALQALREAQLTLIQQIDPPTREGIRAYLLESMAAGRNPTNTVTQLVGTVQPSGARLGGILGLTERQARAVSNYRKFLEGLDPQALERALRDKRFDATVQRAIDESEPLEAAYIDKLVKRYESNYLAYRAETIGRTESLKALQLGQKATWDSVIADGYDESRLTKTWVTARDERVRPAHQDMEGVTVDYDELFDTADAGPIWAPPAVPNCRCIAWIRPQIRRVV